MHENQYHGTGYEGPHEEPVCTACEQWSNLRHVDRGEVCWDEPQVTAHCSVHGRLAGGEFRTIEL